MNRKCKKVCHRILQVVPVHLNKTLSFQLAECWRSIQKFRFSIYAKLRPPLNPMWSMPCFLAQQKMEAIRIQTWLQAWHGLMLWQQHNAETCEISWNHRLSQCKYWTVQFLFAFVELPKVAFLQLQFAIRQYSQPRFTIFVAADPAILAGLGDHLLHHGVFSVAQMFYRLRTSTSMFLILTEFVALVGTKSSQVKLITSTKKYGCFTFEAFQRLQSHWATWSANGSSCEFKSQKYQKDQRYQDNARYIYSNYIL